MRQIQNDLSVEAFGWKDSLALTEEENSEFGAQDCLSALCLYTPGRMCPLTGFVFAK